MKRLEGRSSLVPPASSLRLRTVALSLAAMGCVAFWNRSVTLPHRMATTLEERRRSSRVSLRNPVRAKIGSIAVELADLSEGGCRIESKQKLKEGDIVELEFEWHDHMMKLDAVVVRSYDVEGRFDSGLSFTPASTRSLTGFRRMLETLIATEEIERLRTVVEASKMINSSIDPDSLLDSILSVARKELGVDRGTLYFVDRDRAEIWTKIAESLGETIRLPIGRGIAGSVAETGQPVILHDAYADRRFDRSQDQRSGYRTRSMLCVPIKNRAHETVGVLQLLNKFHGSFGPRDLEFLDAISDHMAIAMENARMHLELVEKQRMERELQLGREIQNRLLPSPPTDIAGVMIAARNVPCFEVGGDYFDFLEFHDGDLGIAIGDVSGKGVGAALVMSSLQAALRVAAPIESDLARLIARLNALIFRSTSGRKYVTFFFARYTPATGALRYVNAGHNPPFIVTNGELQPLPATGRPIGLMADLPYEECQAQLAPGAALVLYTDGLNEAAKSDDEEFGMDRLEEAISRAAESAPESWIDETLRSVQQFEAGAPSTDDKTVVVLRRA